MSQPDMLAKAPKIYDHCIKIIDDAYKVDPDIAKALSEVEALKKYAKALRGLSALKEKVKSWANAWSWGAEYFQKFRRERGICRDAVMRARNNLLESDESSIFERHRHVYSSRDMHQRAWLWADFYRELRSANIKSADAESKVAFLSSWREKGASGRSDCDQLELFSKALENIINDDEDAPQPCKSKLELEMDRARACACLMLKRVKNRASCRAPSELRIDLRKLEEGLEKAALH